MSRRLQRFDLAEQEIELGARRLRIVRPRWPDDLLDAAAATDASTPYWAELWPSAVALATLIARRDLRSCSVLELGCGLGLTGVAAALAGADVIATDVDRDALAFAAENGRRAAGRRLRTMAADFTDPPQALLDRAPFDLVLGADVLYVPETAAGLARQLPLLLAADGEALLTLPWRRQEEPLLDPLVATGWASELEPLPSPPGWPRVSLRLLSLRPPRAAAPGSRR